MKNTVFVVLLAIMALSGCGILVRSAEGVVERVVDPDAVIGNYQYFYDQKSVIDATRIKVAVARENLDATTEGTDAYERALVEYNGVRNVLLGQIAEYNSRSKQINRTLWKAPDLPHQIPYKE